jgi:hypothetical protein
MDSVGYKGIVSMLLRAASSQEQVKRVLDSFDIDGDTVYLFLPSCGTLHICPSGILVGYLYTCQYYFSDRLWG